MFRVVAAGTTVRVAVEHYAPAPHVETVGVTRSPTRAPARHSHALTDSQLAKLMENVVPAWIPEGPATDRSASQMTSTELRAPTLSP